MRRSTLSRLVVLAVVAIALAGCDNNANDTGATNPTTPTPVQVTETFTGNLTPSGGVTHPFTVNTAGIIVATLKEVAPDSTVTIGVSLGTWNGVNCQVVISNDAAIQGNTVTGNVSATGVLCLRIYDAQGTLPVASSYTVDINHP